MAIDYTGGHNLPYPDGNEEFDPNGHIELLAEGVDDALTIMARREGVRVRQGVNQIINTGPLAMSAWTAPGGVADPDGYYSNLNAFEPIVIPAGKGGLYAVTIEYGQSAGCGSRGYVDLRINSGAGGRTVFTGDDQCLLTRIVRLAVGDRLKVEFFSQVQGGSVTTIASMCRIEARRLGS